MTGGLASGSNRRGSAVRTLVILLALLGAGCATHDLGTPCHLLREDNSQQSPRPGHAVVYSGSGECEHFVCVSSGGGSPSCSRPCDREGESCEGGMVCRPAVLDPELLELLRTRLEGRDEDGDGVDDFEQLASGLIESLYCVRES